MIVSTVLIEQHFPKVSNLWEVREILLKYLSPALVKERKAYDICELFLKN